ncbi:putative diphthamide synthesis protein-domain-containing protein [Sphaerosporella brunnea]|uniref:2-(3-amino-3-carboxypropyl)histidine synthase subunit 2 n=1 Tax=Sphaerosporella brunnea TaxID=1250544 RepID=A0A5J5F8L3_9PEZI|nr:putative diphthamide synthesis protein-domain-containing protein [Sphaerosporella brunnea]
MTVTPPPPPPTTAPVLSTPDDHFFTLANAPTNAVSHRDLSDDDFRTMYEVDRTIAEVLAGDYRRVALQFPDESLGDSERVYSMVYQGINAVPATGTSTEEESKNTTSGCCGGKTSEDACCGRTATGKPASERKVFILADTSYSACCVDEIAAEHVSAEVLVHYGRSCLSPTTRLPVIYVFTSNNLSIPAAVEGFKSTYPSLDTKVLLVADVTYASHTLPLFAALKEAGYTNVFPTEIIHDPASLLPNRTLPVDCNSEEALRDWSLFHISEPLPSLLLILSSRVSQTHYFDPRTSSVKSTLSSPLLRRRYALLSHAKSAGIIGILVNTLNIKHYLPMISHLKSKIRAARRKSYLVVVGKVNVEKVANFSEVEVWVGVGCWEQGVVGGTEGRGWYRPVITPWELSIALGERGWDGGWIADFAEVLRIGESESHKRQQKEDEDEVDSDEDAPPEFDLRTGRYISTSRPLSKSTSTTTTTITTTSSALTAPSNRQKELIATGGVLSPAATYLREKRTWQGLGSDLALDQEQEAGGALVEEGRSGVARGYVVGKEGERH